MTAGLIPTTTGNLATGTSAAVPMAWSPAARDLRLASDNQAQLVVSRMFCLGFRPLLAGTNRTYRMTRAGATVSRSQRFNPAPSAIRPLDRAPVALHTHEGYAPDET